MATTINFCKCPKCGEKYGLGFNNMWINSLFGEYPCDYVTHVCEKCGVKFVLSAKEQIKFTTKIIMESEEE